MHKGGSSGVDPLSPGQQHQHHLDFIRTQMRRSKDAQDFKKWKEEYTKVSRMGPNEDIDESFKNNEHLKLYIVNTKEGRREAYDPKKHVNFPTDLRPGKYSEALKQIDEEKKVKPMTKEEEKIKEENVHNLYQGAIHLAREGGTIQDDNGYQYYHDQSNDDWPNINLNQRYGPIRYSVDNKGKTTLRHQ